MKFKSWWIAGLMLAAMARQIEGSVIVIGSNDDDNCYPFSCFASDSNGTTYQQVYDSTAFSGPLNINAISFFKSISGDMDTADYEISFSTTSAPVGGLDTTWANNIGADVASFGTYTVSGAMPAVLTFSGSPFYYDPSMGNLLMQVDVLSLALAQPYESFFQADSTGLVTQRLFANGGSASGIVGTGALVTEFDFSPATAVPEPTSIALLCTGALGLIFARRRRRPTKQAA